MRAAYAVGWIGYALTLAAAPQSPQQTFRSRVDLVDVEVSVLDRNRQPVTGLTAADFTVYEDGRPRPVLAFTPVDLPTRVLPSAPWMDAIAPDVATNVFPREGRLVVILFDRSVSTTQRPVAVEAAESIVAQLRPGDLAAVVYSTFGTPQNFTSDRERLLQAIRRPLAIRADGDPGNPAECYCGTCTLDAIGRVADAIRDVRQRRKILFLIGSNIAIQSSNLCSGPLTQSRNRTTRALDAGNVTVHALDPSGLQTLAPAASQAGAAPPRPTTAHLNRQSNLRFLPERTGGRAALGNRPTETIPAIFRETNSYYVLGVEPISARRPRPLPRAVRQGPPIRSRCPGATGLLHHRQRSARVCSAAGDSAEARERRQDDLAAHRPWADDARGPVRGVRTAILHHRYRRARAAGRLTKGSRWPWQARKASPMSSSVRSIATGGWSRRRHRPRRSLPAAARRRSATTNCASACRSGPAATSCGPPSKITCSRRPAACTQTWSCRSSRPSRRRCPAFSSSVCRLDATRRRSPTIWCQSFRRR